MSLIIRDFCQPRTPGEAFEAMKLAYDGKDEHKAVEDHNYFIVPLFKINHAG